MGCSGGDFEVVACAFATPCDEFILSGGYVEVHCVGVGCECFSAFAALPFDFACSGVDEVECDGCDLRGEGVGIEHVVGEDEAGFVVWVAVAFVVVDDVVASG